MFPFSFEWHWDLGHIIFFGLFYTALTVIGCSLLIGVFMTLKKLNDPDAHHSSNEHHTEHH
jgi:hypothetical protein